MQLFVLGMRGSATSALTRLLNLAGAYCGPEGNVVDTDLWERADVRKLCDGLLRDAGFDWWKVSGFSVDRIPEEVRKRHLRGLRRILLEIDAHRPWVVNEPRLGLLFPLVRPLLEVPLCIQVARDPLGLAESLQAQDGIPLPAGVALWELYTLHSIEASAGLPRLVVHYEDLVSSPVATVRTLIGQLADLGVEGLRIPTERQITACVPPRPQDGRRAPETWRSWLNEQQAWLAAAAVDDGTVLDGTLPPTMSDGGRAILQAFEEDRLRQDRLAEVTEQVARHEDSAKAATARCAALEHEFAAEAERRRHVALAAHDALSAVERDVRGYSRSRAARLASQIAYLRQLLDPRTSTVAPPLERVLKGITRSRHELDRAAADGQQPAQTEQHTSPESSTSEARTPIRSRRTRPKIAVVAWDVGHNPLGRAYTLAGALSRRFDVEIWGAQFRRYGTDVWAPLRGSEIPIKTFPGRDFPDHLTVMEDVARRINADAVYVSKPRMPSYALGILAKRSRNRPLVLDVDDHELAFFDEAEGHGLRDVLASRGEPALREPYERTWTRACEPLIGAADEVTVSNVSLHERFGGVIVPHVRDQRVFDPRRYGRGDLRRRLGVRDDTRLLIFGGTPRAYKGVVEVLQALDRLGDDRYRLLLFGTRELGTLRHNMRGLDRWALPLPSPRFVDLPGIVAAADLACVMQDPSHPVSRYQFPAKIVDALAMCVPCLVRPVPPLRPLLDEGVVHRLDDGESLHERIASIFEQYDEAIERARRGRKIFEATYSYDAAGDVLAPLFERPWDATPPLSPRLRALVDLPRQVFAAAGDRPSRPPRVPGQRRRSIPARAQYDIVMFWKQNDTGIYGRRQDMLLKYLARSERVGSVVHFDSPISPGFLLEAALVGNSRPNQGRLVARQTVNRLLGRHHTTRVHHYTFLHRGPRRLPGLRPREDFPEFVRLALSRHGLGNRPTIFWVYPTNDVLPGVIDALEPDIVVADVVDDHRTFHSPDSPYYDVAEQESFEQNYRDVLARSDLVLANCEPVAEAMRALARDVHVVANGLEVPDRSGLLPRPKELRHLSSPIIGYVGNLSQRLDVPLLRALAQNHRGWQFVMVGSAHGNRSILRLADEPNVHFVGVKPYDVALQFLQHFDVALIPHVDNEMTRSMNPLKAFVYCASGLPVVSTPVANLGDLADLITIARDPTEFGAAIERALRWGRQEPDLDRLVPHSWERRVDQVIDLIDRTVQSTP